MAVTAETIIRRIAKRQEVEGVEVTFSGMDFFARAAPTFEVARQQAVAEVERKGLTEISLRDFGDLIASYQRQYVATGRGKTILAAVQSLSDKLEGK